MMKSCGAPADARLEHKFVESLPELESVIRAIGRSQRLKEHEIDDFASSIKLKMVESHYRALSRFEGRSSLKTYLRTVVQRLFVDLRRRDRGKWRSSAAARRLGPEALALERFVCRDGMAAEEAILHLKLNALSVTAIETLEAFLEKLPVRPRRVNVTLASLVETEADRATITPEESLHTTREAKRAQAIIESVLAQLLPLDLLLLQRRFEHGESIASVARDFRLDAKRLYRRMETVLAGLRKRLLASGTLQVELMQLMESGQIQFRWPKTRTLEGVVKPASLRSRSVEGARLGASSSRSAVDEVAA